MCVYTNTQIYMYRAHTYDFYSKKTSGLIKKPSLFIKFLRLLVRYR